MSIRLIAQDLYRVIREVEQLEKRIASLPHEKRAKLEDELRKLKAERDYLRNVLNGQKG